MIWVQAGVSSKYSHKKVYQFVHETCTALAASHSELALGIFLQCALSATSPGFANEFFSQAFILYEDIADSKLQVRCLQRIITALHSCLQIEVENYGTPPFLRSMPYHAMRTYAHVYP